MISFEPSLHDSSLFFDDDGKVYMLWGGGSLRLVELKEDLTGIKEGGFNEVIIENASAPAGDNIMLGAEGSQLFKHDGKYYLFNITWPRGGMRTVVLHRADKITGPWEGRLGLQDQGVAQGGMIDTPDGKWYAYLFQDHGAVGRIPYLVPMKWEDGWPVLGVDGKVPMELNLPASKGLIPGIVDSDEFDRNEAERRTAARLAMEPQPRQRTLVADGAPRLPPHHDRPRRRQRARGPQHAYAADHWTGVHRDNCRRRLGPQGRRPRRAVPAAAELWAGGR